MFKVVGELNGIPAWLGWDNGTFSGSPTALQAIDLWLHDNKQVPVTPTGPFLEPDKADEACAYAIAYNVLGGVVDVIAGEAPEMDTGDAPADADE